MLIEFRVSNYRSIGDEQILSLIPAVNKSADASDNIMLSGRYKSLNALAIYGPNASGKSNLLYAMSLLDRLVHSSTNSNSNTRLPYDPFLLRKGLESTPTMFEITFVTHENRYRYGLKFTRDKVVEEWLYRKHVGREVYLFLREGEVIDTASGFQGKKRVINLAIEATRPNALFLSTCDAFNVDEAKVIFRWFKNFYMIDGLNTKTISTVALWADEAYQKIINNYMAKLGLGPAEIEIAPKDSEPSQPSNGIQENPLTNQSYRNQGISIYAKHNVYSVSGDKTGDTQTWKFEERESAGTNKALHLSGPILWSLLGGGVLIIDEIEAKLHPLMTLEIINLFLNKETNPHKAQLIFATHDTNLLTYTKLRRDQIYFSMKNSWESTEIYSLSDFVYMGNKKEGPDGDKEKRYLEGRYGAVPNLSDLQYINLTMDGTEGKTKTKD